MPCARFVSLHDALSLPKTERGCDSALTPRVTPFPALELGPLLGRGSYGRVYRGKHLGRPVAVKVGSLRTAQSIRSFHRFKARLMQYHLLQPMCLSVSGASSQSARPARILRRALKTSMWRSMVAGPKRFYLRWAPACSWHLTTWILHKVVGLFEVHRTIVQSAHVRMDSPKIPSMSWPSNAGMHDDAHFAMLRRSPTRMCAWRATCRWRR